LAALITLEVALRVLGFGASPDFVIAEKINGEKVYLNNDRFGLRFFDRGLNRIQHPFLVPAEKPPNVQRIFVLGGSAAMGVPDATYSFGRILERMLNAKYPERDFEVVNMAMTAINSHVVREIAKDVRKLEPDVYVFYLGNNEVVGPYGPGTVFSSFQKRLLLIRVNMRLRSTRTGQFFDRVVRGGLFGSGPPKEWRGLEMFLGNQISADDPRLNHAYRHFETNLREMCRLAFERGAKTVLCTVGVNLKDSPPFASQHDPDLGEADLTRWGDSYKLGVEHQESGRFAQALEAYSNALELDAKHAELHFRVAKCHWSAGNFERAAVHFRRVAELDTLRFRANPRINQIIRDVSRSHRDSDVTLVDTTKELEQNSPHATPVEELFVEHVHLSFHGNYLIARSIADELERMFSDTESGRLANDQTLTEDECKQSLAYTDWDEYRLTNLLVEKVFSTAPFTHQYDHSVRLDALSRELERMRLEMEEDFLRRVDREYQQALESAENDPWLHYNYGQFLLDGMQQPRRASNEFRSCLQELPHYEQGANHMAITLMLDGQPEQARRYLTQALRRNPDSLQSLNSMGIVLAQLAKYDEAKKYFSDSLKIAPNAEARYNLGLTLVKQQRFEEAIPHYEAALELNPDHAKAHYELAKVLTNHGDRGVAVRHYREAVRLDPTLPHAQLNLAMTLEAIGNREEAIIAYREAVNRQPEDVTSRKKIALALARQGEYDDAIDHVQSALKMRPDDANLRKMLIKLREHARDQTNSLRSAP